MHVWTYLILPEEIECGACGDDSGIGEGGGGHGEDAFQDDLCCRSALHARGPSDTFWPHHWQQQQRGGVCLHLPHYVCKHAVPTLNGGCTRKVGGAEAEQHCGGVGAGHARGQL